MKELLLLTLTCVTKVAASAATFVLYLAICDYEANSSNVAIHEIKNLVEL